MVLARYHDPTSTADLIVDTIPAWCYQKFDCPAVVLQVELVDNMIMRFLISNMGRGTKIYAASYSCNIYTLQILLLLARPTSLPRPCGGWHANPHLYHARRS